MPITINGNGAISGLGDIDGHDLETATLVVSGDTTIAPQAVGRASLFIDDSTNSVGINTTTPSTLLEVQGKGDKQVLRLTNPTNTDTAIAFNDSSNPTGNAVQLGTKSGAFQFVTGSLERLRITNDGKFGINTDTPTELIEARGDVDASNLFLTTNSTAADSGATIGFQSTTNGWSLAAAHAQIKGGRVDGSNGYLDFFTRQSATITQVMRLDENGRVGIGVINPASDLQVNPHPNTNIGTQSLFVAGTKSHFANYRGLPQNQLVIYDDTAGTARSGGAIGFCANAGSTQETWLASIESERDSNVTDGSNYGGSLVFYTRPAQSIPIEAARFNSTGNLAFPNGQGIDFSASEGASASSSILDDYEEGTWTPDMDLSGGGSITLDIQDGIYERIGSVVHLYARMRITAVNSTGNLRFQGFPFRVAPTTSSSAQYGILEFGGPGFVYSSSNIGLIQVSNTFGDGTGTPNGFDSSQFSHSNVQNGDIWLRGTYRTAE